MRCRSCNHMHLSHLVSRPRLFSHYLYVSGTSKTLLDHFEWLADRVSADVATLPANMQHHAPSGEKPLAVLELACNDGSQLDAFKKRGWKTYGVDPAANIAHTAIAKGHHIQVGFWGAENVWPPNELPVHLDAIVAQNVLAGRYRVVSSSYLSSATSWWLAADPQDLPAMEVAFLNGQRSPTVETADADFNVLGIQMRGYFDFGCAQAESKGAYKMATS